jgi:hypothetical protein
MAKRAVSSAFISVAAYDHSSADSVQADKWRAVMSP